MRTLDAKPRFGPLAPWPELIAAIAAALAEDAMTAPERHVHSVGLPDGCTGSLLLMPPDDEIARTLDVRPSREVSMDPSFAYPPAPIGVDEEGGFWVTPWIARAASYVKTLRPGEDPATEAILRGVNLDAGLVVGPAGLAATARTTFLDATNMGSFDADATRDDDTGMESFGPEATWVGWSPDGTVVGMAGHGRRLWNSRRLGVGGAGCRPRVSCWPASEGLTVRPRSPRSSTRRSVRSLAVRPPTRSLSAGSSPACLSAGGLATVVGRSQGQQALIHCSVRRHKCTPQVRLAKLLVGSPAIAEAVVQEAFASVRERWADLERPDAHLRTSVVNGCTGILRLRTIEQRYRAARIEVADSELPEQLIDLRGALDRLTDRQRLVVVLRHFADLPDEEIAEALDSRPATVRSLVYRANG